MSSARDINSPPTRRSLSDKGSTGRAAGPSFMLDSAASTLSIFRRWTFGALRSIRCNVLTLTCANSESAAYDRSAAFRSFLIRSPSLIADSGYIRDTTPE